MRRIALLLALLVAGCGREAEKEAAVVGPPSVVLISVDTLRSDRLPAYGYQGVQTPAIDRLRSDAILFERAYAHYPLTLPSHASLLSGLLPTEHGVRDNIGYRLDAAHPHLARWLQGRGYATGGAVSSWILRAETGLGAGFDFYEDRLDLRGGVALGESQRPGSDTLERAVDWLRQVPEEKSFFLFLHFYEPHTPYEPPEPFLSRYADPYDGEIAASDALVGKLVEELSRLGRYENSIIVFLSDHGEGFGDHGEREHGILLHREAIQVPLIVKLPGQRHAGETVEAVAGLQDVVPTVKAILGEPDGRVTLLDLLGNEAPERTIYSETYYPRIHLGWSDLSSLVDERFHYIEGPEPELYDLVADPEETSSVLRAERRALDRLRREMAGLRTELKAPSEVDPEAAERLAALGYLASSSVLSEGPLPDPKSQLPTLDRLMEALHHLAQKDYEAAVVSFREVLAASPGMIDAWENLAHALQQSGRFEESEEAFREALERSGGSDRVALSAARLFMVQARWDDARSHAELALDSNPSVAHQLLGEIDLATERYDEAERHAHASLEERREGVPALLILAQVQTSRDRLEEAQKLVDRAEAEQKKRHGDGATPGLYYVKGDIAARLGEASAAIASFEEEIRLYPRDTRSYCRLAVVYTVEGRAPEASAMLRQMVETNPRPAAYAAAVETLRTLGDPRSAQGLLQYALGLFPGDPVLLELLAEPS